MFQLKSKNGHQSSMICEATYTCKETCISETSCNVDTHKDSMPANILKNHSGYSFTLKVLFSASTDDCVRKNINASIITFKWSSLNKQVKSKKRDIFRGSVA